MEQILPPDRTVYSLCGEQKRGENLSYRPTNFLVRTECGEGTLLFHTLTGELLLLSPGEERPDEALIRKRFLVPGDFDDNRYADEIYRIAAMMRRMDGAMTDYTILTTTDCNARCYYCYEKGIKKVSMTEETALAAAEYIARVSCGKNVRLHWFSGEPLYNRKAIDLICAALEQKGIRFESSMTSNGYYLDKETVNDAVTKWKLNKVQITLDGTEKKYNRTKAYIDKDRNPYERVMNNIREALDAGIRINIRLNMDAENAADLLLLCDDLAVRFKERANLSVYAAILQEFGVKIRTHETQEQKEKDYFAIREKLKQSGLLHLRKLPVSLRQYRCMADNEAAEMIMPDGRIGRCEQYSEDVITGSIASGDRDKDVIRKWKEPLTVPECSHCALYPKCRKLAMCESYKNGCGDLNRRVELMEIREQMQKSYLEWRKGGTDHEIV